jgi:hypothetical protein
MIATGNAASLGSVPLLLKRSLLHLYAVRQSGNRFANTVPTQRVFEDQAISAKSLI